MGLDRRERGVVSDSSPPARHHRADLRLLKRLRRLAARAWWPSALLEIAGWAGLLAIAWNMDSMDPHPISKVMATGPVLILIGLDELRRRGVRPGLARLWEILIGRSRPDLLRNPPSTFVLAFFFFLFLSPLILVPLVCYLDGKALPFGARELLICWAVIVAGRVLRPVNPELRGSLRELEAELRREG